MSKDIPKNFQNYAAIEAAKQLLGAKKIDFEKNKVLAKRFTRKNNKYFIVCNFTDNLGTTSYHQENVIPKKSSLLAYFFKSI